MFNPDKAQRGDILQYRSANKDVVGGAIGFFSNLFGRKSDYVHTAYYLGANRVLQSSMEVDKLMYIRGAKESGVHIAYLDANDWKLIDVYRVGLTVAWQHTIEQFLYAQLYKGYDAPAFPSAFVRSVLGFFSEDRPLLNDNMKWFCSELIAVAFDKACIRLVPGIHPRSVIPADIGSSRCIAERVC